MEINRFLKYLSHSFVAWRLLYICPHFSDSFLSFYGAFLILFHSKQLMAPNSRDLAQRKSLELLLESNFNADFEALKILPISPAKSSHNMSYSAVMDALIDHGVDTSLSGLSAFHALADEDGIYSFKLYFLTIFASLPVGSPPPKLQHCPHLSS